MVHAALGYAKAARRLQTLACTASIGPGATNMLTGAATATVNRLPVLLLPADTFASRRSGVVLQQLEHPAAATSRQRRLPAAQPLLRPGRPARAAADALPAAMRVLLDPADDRARSRVALHQDVLGEARGLPASSSSSRRTWLVSRPPARSGGARRGRARAREAHGGR